MARNMSGHFWPLENRIVSQYARVHDSAALVASVIDRKCATEGGHLIVCPKKVRTTATSGKAAPGAAAEKQTPKVPFIGATAPQISPEEEQHVLRQRKLV